jgi:hypothetical protein
LRRCVASVSTFLLFFPASLHQLLLLLTLLLPKLLLPMAFLESQMLLWSVLLLASLLLLAYLLMLAPNDNVTVLLASLPLLASQVLLAYLLMLDTASRLCFCLSTKIKHCDSDYDTMTKIEKICCHLTLYFQLKKTIGLSISDYGIHFSIIGTTTKNY